eukprot:TRINITY_DN12277_c0_g1_i1.p1 TRINITY_DN12277_c0_g1~~TRINITY_DN12277_c0_g1_i1.p1  ORF type:complete len:902 (+),score=48.53 TRINITY_DN12277_c0_g1_i1:181-2886(+)
MEKKEKRGGKMERKKDASTVSSRTFCLRVSARNLLEALRKCNIKPPDEEICKALNFAVDGCFISTEGEDGRRWALECGAAGAPRAYVDSSGGFRITGVVSILEKIFNILARQWPGNNNTIIKLREWMKPPKAAAVVLVEDAKKEGGLLFWAADQKPQCRRVQLPESVKNAVKQEHMALAGAVTMPRVVLSAGDTIWVFDFHTPGHSWGSPKISRCLGAATRVLDVALSARGDVLLCATCASGDVAVAVCEIEDTYIKERSRRVVSADESDVRIALSPMGARGAFLSGGRLLCFDTADLQDTTGDVYHDVNVPNGDSDLTPHFSQDGVVLRVVNDDNQLVWSACAVAPQAVLGGRAGTVDHAEEIGVSAEVRQAASMYKDQSPVRNYKDQSPVRNVRKEKSGKGTTIPCAGARRVVKVALLHGGDDKSVFRMGRHDEAQDGGGGKSQDGGGGFWWGLSVFGVAYEYNFDGSRSHVLEADIRKVAAYAPDGLKKSDDFEAVFRHIRNIPESVTARLEMKQLPEKRQGVQLTVCTDSEAVFRNAGAPPALAKSLASARKHIGEWNKPVEDIGEAIQYVRETYGWSLGAETESLIAKSLCLGAAAVASRAQRTQFSACIVSGKFVSRVSELCEQRVNEALMLDNPVAAQCVRRLTETVEKRCEGSVSSSGEEGEQSEDRRNTQTAGRTHLRMFALGVRTHQRLLPWLKGVVNGEELKKISSVAQKSVKDTDTRSGVEASIFLSRWRHEDSPRSSSSPWEALLKWGALSFAITPERFATSWKGADCGEPPYDFAKHFTSWDTRLSVALPLEKKAFSVAAKKELPHHTVEALYTREASAEDIEKFREHCSEQVRKGIKSTAGGGITARAFEQRRIPAILGAGGVAPRDDWDDDELLISDEEDKERGG